MLQLIEINLYFHSKVVLKHRRLLVTKATEMIDQCKQVGIRPNDTIFFVCVNITSDGIMSFWSLFFCLMLKSTMFQKVDLFPSSGKKMGSNDSVGSVRES
jgi:hypothetical protein